MSEGFLFVQGSDLKVPLMSSGIPIRSIALLDPTTSLWTQMGNPFHNFHYIGNDDSEMAKLQRLKQDWSEISKQLLFHHKQFYSFRGN